MDDITDPRLRFLEFCACFYSHWVNGVSIHDIATSYFMREGDDITSAITTCGQNLFGKLTHTAAWGLGALLSITGSELPEEQFRLLSNLPSRVYYGVNDDAAIALRLLGVPRYAAPKLAQTMENVLEEPITSVRVRLRNMDDIGWTNALGKHEGLVYKKVWRVLEGLE